MSDQPDHPAPRRIVPTGPLGPPDTSAPAPGRMRTTITARADTAVTAPAPDGLPLPPQSLWRGYGQTGERYIELASAHADSMLRVLDAAGVPADPSPRVLDFGCAAAPMLRMVRHRRPMWEMWGCDIDPLAIDWCRRHLPESVRVFTGTTAPHLPLSDGSFDLVYAGSVFTHIEHLADAWLLELARVLRPGGHLYATIHDRAFIAHTIADAPHWRLTLNILKHFSRAQLDADWAWMSMGTGTNANIFYDRAHFLRMATAGFTCVSVTERAYGSQTALLLRRNPT